jgi:DNA polymerase elongation subunit (family B)
MEFEYARLSENPTREQIENEIERLKGLIVDYKNKNSALKIILNSIYGVAGYKNFICYDRDVAESITLQSQDLIKYTIRIYNEFFKDEWHKLHDLHTILGITKVPEIKHDVINYADTDSVFAVLRGVIDSTDFIENGTLDLSEYTGRKTIPEINDQDARRVDFVLTINKVALKKYIDKRLFDYIDKYHGFQTKTSGDQSLNLDMEQICKSVLWVKKKKYIKDPTWEEGKFMMSMSSMQVKGLELNQSSIPQFVRGKLKDVVEYLMETGGKIDTNTLLTMLRAVKAEFTTVPTQNICRVERISNYEKWIINDVTNLEFVAGVKPHVKGAAYHNYLLKNSEYMNRYGLIKSGTKAHWYYSKGGLTESFAFLTGEMPQEIAPQINMDLQYEKIFLGPLNNIFKAIGIPNLNAGLNLFQSFNW